MSDKNKRLDVSEMDFDSIKTNLINYLSEDEILKDTNFQGSAANTLLDALVYITHMNALNANMALNETFLDSAQIRESVVSHAKLLGYVPRSSFAPVAYIDVTINNPVNVTNVDGDFIPMTMNKGTQFTSLISGRTYTFVTDTSYTITRNTNGLYKFENVKILQGSYKKTTYIFDQDSDEKFVIPYENAVTSSLTVTVQQSSISTESTVYEPAPNVTGITSESNVYFLQEGRDGFYEVYFGDGVIGNKPLNGNVITLEYIVTDNDEANGATQFSLSDTIQGNADATIDLRSKAVGGSAREDIESIKFNAPLSYASQNRAVTPDDYKSIVLNAYPNIDAISVWGGEDNDPPDFGKVFLSIKPKDAETLSAQDKELIISQYLKPKNVVSITPEIVDPTYTYIFLQVFFKYNPNLTDDSATELAIKVRAALKTYNDNELKRFDGVFRNSNVLNTIDNADASIVSSTARIFMKKRLVPTLGVETKYTLNFSSPIYTTSSNEQVIRSTEFTYLGQQCTLRDRLSADGTRRIQIVRGVGANEAIIVNDAGSVDEANGIVELTAFAPSAFTGSYIEITASPESNDLAPKRNELLSILVDELEISGEVDTMITGGTSAGIEYTTVPRH